jgi:hypothetical protein
MTNDSVAGMASRGKERMKWLQRAQRFCGCKMAVGGSRWQFLGRAAIHLAPRDAFDNEFFSWLTKPSLLSAACSSTMVLCHTKGCLGITAAGSLVMSEMTHVLARSRFVRVFETGRYDSRRPICARILIACVNSDRT